jgi:biopolymer transport protein ExbD
MGIQLGKNSSDEGEGEIFTEINITPLTDIFLVLLIIFMVTSSVMTNTGVDVNLPQASQATSQAQPEGVVVSLLPQGGMQVNGQTISAGDFEGLEAGLKSAFSQSTSRLVILEGDRQAFLGSAIQVMDTARKAGAEKFAIATSSSDSERK